jgi:hypothetical protein
MLKGLIYNCPFMFSYKAFSFYDLNFFPEDIHASSNLTDSGRRKYYYDLRMSYSIRSVDRKYVFVFYNMSCYYIPVNCISVNLIKKTRNKQHVFDQDDYHWHKLT